MNKSIKVGLTVIAFMWVAFAFVALSLMISIKVLGVEYGWIGMLFFLSIGIGLIVAFFHHKEMKD